MYWVRTVAHKTRSCGLVRVRCGGEAVIPGLQSLDRADDGQEISLRIADIPAHGYGGATAGVLAAAYEKYMLETEWCHALLEGLLRQHTVQSHGTGRGRDAC